MINKTKLNKRLVELALAPSRRAADKLISQQKVRVNGRVSSDLTTRVDPTDKITVGQRRGLIRENIYLLFNKPVGYVCSHRVEKDQLTIFALLPKSFAGLKFVGRLDRDSSGLLILTSDGDFVQKISHPKNTKMKYYQVKLDRPLHKIDSQKLLGGVKLDDGLSRFDELKVISESRVRLAIHSGRKRQIRRSFAALGYTVTELRRYQIGSNLTIAGLKPGQYRFLTKSEVDLLCR